MEPIYKLNKNVRVAVFGVSRSGKDYTIEDCIKLADADGYHFVHLSPMELIRKRLGDRHLKDMSEEEKQELVSEVKSYIDDVASRENVIIDEHYCYPHTFGGKELKDGYYDEKLPHDILRIPKSSTYYEVVFPRFESMKYDVIGFMDIDPKTIVERMRTSEGCKKNLIATEEEIREWSNIEKSFAYGEGIFYGRYAIVRDPKNSGKELWGQIHSAIYSMYIDLHPEEW